MKNKFFIASLLLAGACMTVNAQEDKYYTETGSYTEKGSDNIFVGLGVGAMSVINDGMNTPTFNMNVTVGKYITPVWGVRGQIGGFWGSLDEQSTGYHRYCKKFGEINLDAMLDLINLFGKNNNPNHPFNLYLFAGPTMNIGKAVDNVTSTDMNITINGSTSETSESEFNEHGMKARFGATVGLGLGYNITDKWALNLEGRIGVTPSMFGNASDCLKAEATARVNLGVAYTFGGKNFVTLGRIDRDAINEEINRYRSELEKTRADLAACRDAKANAKPEIREVVKEVQVAGPRAIFFKIGSARIDDYGKVNIKLAAEILKANPDKKYKIAGYCDKATGSAPFNQKLSEKRAQAVYDALVAEGVDKDQLELIGYGGTENMWGKNFLNRVVILE